MAIYKRYNTRRKKINYPLIIWACAILLIFTATVILGLFLGAKADGGEPYITGDIHGEGESDTLESVIPNVMQAVYVEPSALEKFTAEDASVYASTWIFRDGESCFATEVDKALGNSTDKKPSLESFAISHPVSGMFEVSSIYAEENVRDVLSAYEKAVLEEISQNGPDETVLVYSSLSEENSDIIIAHSKYIGGNVIAVPYEALYSDYFVKFLSSVKNAGFTLALMADKLTAEKLAADIEDYAVYFTRDFIRIMLSGKDTSLPDVLKEKNILNYQFYS
ncbi:MAG: hypothetical protein IKU61_01875 [Clostridia bacterium]|nr:hypothetical protein [Clostridia bacterium]